MMIHRSSPWATDFRDRGWLACVLLAVLLAGCGNRATAEQQVRAVVASGEAAAEQRNLAAIMELVSSRYEDATGGSAVELSRNLRRYFIANPSVHLLVRIEGVEFPYKDMARVRLTIGSLGRQAAGRDTVDLAADVQDVRLELQLERGEWKVTRAAWQPLVRA
jgi:hypothetical protein